MSHDSDFFTTSFNLFYNPIYFIPLNERAYFTSGSVYSLDNVLFKTYFTLSCHTGKINQKEIYSKAINTKIFFVLRSWFIFFQGPFWSFQSMLVSVHGLISMMIYFTKYWFKKRGFWIVYQASFTEKINQSISSYNDKNIGS